MFESVVDPIFSPLLNLKPIYTIGIIALAASLIISLVYKALTDQHLLKAMKEETKKLQKEMKELKDDPQKMMAVQKKMMEKSMQQMKHSLKPTLVTFLPVIMIFGWLQANLAYYPIEPNQEFTTSIDFKDAVSGDVEIDIVPDSLDLLSDKIQEIEDNHVYWRLKGPAGEYSLKYTYKEETYFKDLLITRDNEYENPVNKISDNYVKQISIDNEPIRPLSFSIFGWKPGWLGTYILFSLIFSLTVRKLLRVH